MKRLLYVFGLLLLVFIILALRPIYNLENDDCLPVSGTVQWIGSGGPADIVFKLHNDERVFYINRGEESGLSIKDLRASLTDRKIELLYADHWTPLDPRSQHRHVSKLVFEGEVLYNELIDEIRKP